MPNATSQELQDAYNTLGLGVNASLKDIQNAHRKLALQYHPDKNKQPDAAEQFKKMQNAFELIMHEEKFKEASQPQPQKSRPESKSSLPYGHFETSANKLQMDIDKLKKELQELSNSVTSNTPITDEIKAQRKTYNRQYEKLFATQLEMQESLQGISLALDHKDERLNNILTAVGLSGNDLESLHDSLTELRTKIRNNIEKETLAQKIAEEEEEEKEEKITETENAPETPQEPPSAQDTPTPEHKPDILARTNLLIVASQIENELANIQAELLKNAENMNDETRNKLTQQLTNSLSIINGMQVILQSEPTGSETNQKILDATNRVNDLRNTAKELINKVDIFKNNSYLITLRDLPAAIPAARSDKAAASTPAPATNLPAFTKAQMTQMLAPINVNVQTFQMLGSNSYKLQWQNGSLQRTQQNGKTTFAINFDKTDPKFLQTAAQTIARLSLEERKAANPNNLPMSKLLPSLTFTAKLGARSEETPEEKLKQDEEFSKMIKTEYEKLRNAEIAAEELRAQQQIPSPESAPSLSNKPPM